jgi:hypothetical protein
VTILAFGKQVLAVKFILLAMSKVTSLTCFRFSKGIFSIASIRLSLLTPFIQATKVPFFPRPFLLVK